MDLHHRSDRALAAVAVGTISRARWRRTLAILMLGLACAGNVVAGQFEDAMSALLRGNYSAALRYLQPAAIDGNAAAQYNLGLMYFHGIGVPQDDAEAVKWFRRAAAQGEPSAQYNLGVMCEMGWGAPQSFPEAARWYRAAAEQGQALAASALGTKYYSGEGVAQDYREAFRWFQKAAEQGVAQAQFSLGTMYWRGQGTSQSNVDACMWLTLAAARFPEADAAGRAAAVDNRNAVAAKMTPEEIARAEKLAAAWTAK
jgi:TPR repeat protein